MPTTHTHACAINPNAQPATSHSAREGRAGRKGGGAAAPRRPAHDADDRARTVLLHHLQELDDDLGGRAQQHLALATLLSVRHRLQGIGQHAHAHHLDCGQATTSGGTRRKTRHSWPQPAPQPTTAGARATATLLRSHTRGITYRTEVATDNQGAKGHTCSDEPTRQPLENVWRRPSPERK